MNCRVCGQPTAEGDLVLIEERWVCGGCKPTVVQQIREGCVDEGVDVLPSSFGERILGYGELLKTTWRICRQDWLAILGLVLLVAIPINLILTAVAPDYSAMTDDEALRQAGRDFRQGRALEGLIGIIATLGIYKIVSERVQGRSLGFGGGLAHGLRRYWPAIWTGIIEDFLIFFLFLMLLVPGVIWMGYYAFTAGVVSLAEVSGKRALDVSKGMVKGRWWAVVGRATVLILLSLVPAVAVALGHGFSPWSENEAVDFAADVICDMCFAFSTVGMAVLFLNLRAIEVWGTLKVPAVSSTPKLT